MIAARTRTALISQHEPLIAETVFSHPSELDLITEAHGQGYEVTLHALLIPEDLAVLRVARRVDSGGHDVPEIKIRQRAQRLWPLVSEAILRVDSAVVYDHTATTGPRAVARFRAGLAVSDVDWPPWTPKPLLMFGTR